MSLSTDRNSDSSIRIVQIIGGVIGASLLAGIVWASAASSVVDGLRQLAENRWGLVTLVDVYAGAFVVAAWMKSCEPRWSIWLLWVIGLLCLGHLVSIAFLLARSLRARTIIDLFAADGLSPWGRDRRSQLSDIRSRPS